MIIENDIKLDFKDVLIRPKRSILKSRSEVDLNRSYIFKHNPNFKWKGVPIMISNMDTTGTFEMIKEVHFEKTTYADLPYKFEAGTPNIAGVIALKSSIDFIEYGSQSSEKSFASFIIR